MGVELQGWHEDPFRQHEARYFSAGLATKLVRDGNVESYNELPGEGVPGSEAPTSCGHAVSGTPNRTEENEANSLSPFDGDMPAYARRRPRFGVLAAIGVVAIAGAVTAAVVVGKSGPAAAPVTETMAYTATMNASSADVHLVFAVTTGNHKADATTTESGPVSWSADQGETAMTMTTGGRQIMTGQQIFDGRKTYSKFSIKGLPDNALAGLAGVDGWRETTWTGASSPDMSGILPSLLFAGLSNPAGITNPASLLGLLRAQASSIQSLGGEVLGGINTTHYRALIPLSHLGPGSAAEELQLQQILGASFIGVDYWIDSSHLLRQLRYTSTMLRQPSDVTSSPGEVTLPPSTYPITMSLSLQLSHYGTPVHIVPPPSAKITSRGTCVTSADGFNCTE